MGIKSKTTVPPVGSIYQCIQVDSATDGSGAINVTAVYRPVDSKGTVLETETLNWISVNPKTSPTVGDKFIISCRGVIQ